jgi:hypothetical protein
MKSRIMKSGVYIFGSKEQGWFKIGKSSHIDSRIGALNTSVPFPGKVIRKYLVEPRATLEKFLHDQMAEHRLRGEWFAFAWKNIVECDALVKEFLDRVPQAKRAKPTRIKIDRYAETKEWMARSREAFDALPLAERRADVVRRLRYAKSEKDEGAINFLIGLLDTLDSEVG